MINDVRAIIPVAGVGSRLRPHTYSMPKVLLHVAGKPILGHILDELKSLGISKVTLIVGYRGEMIRDFVESTYHFQTTYVAQEELKGLGHAISLTRESARDAKRLLIVLGDTVFKVDLHKVLKSEVSLIGVKEVEDPQRFGIIELRGGAISGMVEKPEAPKTNMAIVGIYYVTEPAILFECLEENIRRGKTTKGEFQLTDALQRMLERGVEMKPFTVDGWYDCGGPEALLRTNREMLTHLKSLNSEHAAERFPGCIVNAPVSIARTAELENSIVGPYVTVADRATIKNAVVRDSIISRNASVANIFLERSIVSDNAKVESKPYRLNVGDSSEFSFA
ncbi:MAG: sugar phosphate nucleotidyltransferase [Candidatus Sumerlaeota bacterium]|nr:sugar phosphate nucleotidyltransferase [Candidatus Sumerlaeota bacterium]